MTHGLALDKTAPARLTRAAFKCKLLSLKDFSAPANGGAWHNLAIIPTMFLEKKEKKKELMLEPKVDIFQSHFRDYCELLISLVPLRMAIVEKRSRTLQNSFQGVWCSQVHSVVPLPD